MQLKWMEDFIALAQERSFTRAAELRHVTHPAFGRRIRALEAWAGTALVERGGAQEQDAGHPRGRGGAGGPVRLTAAGTAFLATAEQLARELSQSQGSCAPSPAGRRARSPSPRAARWRARRWRTPSRGCGRSCSPQSCG